jgi:hypothetical protein
LLSTYPQISALARIAKAKQINRIRADLRTLKQGMRGSSALASSQMPKSQSRSKPARMFFARQWNLRLVWASRRQSPGPRWSHRKRGKADGWRSGDRRESLRKSADGTYVIKRHVLLLCYSLYLWIQPRGQRTAGGLVPPRPSLHGDLVRLLPGNRSWRIRPPASTSSRPCPR